MPNRFSFIFQSSVLTLRAVDTVPIHLTERGLGPSCDNPSAGCCSEVKAAVRVMMWTVDSSQSCNPLQGTNAPLTIQVKVTIRPCRGHLTTRTAASGWWAWCVKCEFCEVIPRRLPVYLREFSVCFKLETVECDSEEQSVLITYVIYSPVI